MTPDEQREAKDLFLASFAVSGIIKSACDSAGISRDTLYYTWLKNDPAFKAAYDIALEESNDVIREEIRRRAITGVVKTTKVVEESPDGTTTKITTVREYDSALLRFFAQSRMAEFKERLDITTAGEKVESPYEAIASIVSDPERAESAARLIESIAGYSQHSSGPSVSGE